MTVAAHGGDIYQNQITYDFSVNTNPLPLPEILQKRMAEAAVHSNRYPQYDNVLLRERLAALYGFSTEEVVCGNGASELFVAIVHALRPKRVGILAPSFSGYAWAAQTVGAEICSIPLREENNFEPQSDILRQLTPDIDFVVICNPNNPTGKLINKELLTEIIEKCQKLNIKILIDECFMDFVADENAYSMIEKLQSNNNLIILKAFTKTYAMPGLRLGYCLTADTDLLLRLHECGQDWNVSVPAQEAGCAALDETAYVEKAKKLIAKERRYLTAALNRLGAKTYGSEANYIFFKLEQPQDLKEQLLKNGFLIRSCANYHNLNGNYYRIAVKRHAVNIRFIKALKEVQNNALINGDN